MYRVHNKEFYSQKEIKDYLASVVRANDNKPILGPPYTEDVLYVELEDIDTGEHFGIPHYVNQEITELGIRLYRNRITTSVAYAYSLLSAYEIVDIWETINHTLIIVTVISTRITNGVTYHKFRQIIPFDPR
jgi:hypothetical protein